MRFLLLFTVSSFVNFLPQQTTMVQAQRRPPTRLRAKPLRGSAEVLAIRPGFLQVKTSGGEWILKVEAPPDKIVVQGEAVPSWLRKGMYVRFSAELNKKGMAQAPIEELFVFSPGPQFRIGVFPESNLLFEDSQEIQQKTKSTRPRRRARSEGRYLVAGRLASLRKGTMRVAAGETITAPLAENAKIRVDIMGNYSVVRKGDKVEFEGHYFEKGKAAVRLLTFTAASPFGSEASDPPPRKPARPKKNRRQQRDDNSTDSAS